MILTLIEGSLVLATLAQAGMLSRTEETKVCIVDRVQQRLGELCCSTVSRAA